MAQMYIKLVAIWLLLAYCEQNEEVDRKVSNTANIPFVLTRWLRNKDFTRSPIARDCAPGLLIWFQERSKISNVLFDSVYNLNACLTPLYKTI